MRVFLTGATGFLGSHIAETLVEAGHELTCSVRLSSRTRWLDPLDVETATFDLGTVEPGELASVLSGHDALIHCGALTRARDEREFMRVNAEGTGRIGQAAVQAGLQRMVFISSLAARGPDGAAGPVSPYGRSKAEAERLLAGLEAGLEIVVLRPGGVYGPRDSDLLPLFKMAARGRVIVPRSEQQLQPVFVEDVASASVAALAAPVPAAPLPVAHGARQSWAALAAALGEAVGRPGHVTRVPPAMFWTAGLISEMGARLTGKAPAMDRRRARDLSHHQWTCDVAKTETALGWTPRVELREGLLRTAAWYRDQGWL